MCGARASRRAAVAVPGARVSKGVQNRTSQSHPPFSEATLDTNQLPGVGEAQPAIYYASDVVGSSNTEPTWRTQRLPESYA